MIDYPANICLDEDVLIKTNMVALALRLQKTSWSRPIYASWPYIFKTSCQDVFKTSSGRLWKRLQDIFKTSSRRLQRYLEVELFLLTRLWEAFNTFLRVSFPKTIIYWGIYPGNTTSDKFMVSVQNLQEW